MWFRCLGLICDLIGVGFGGVGLICDLWLWVCFVVFCGFVLWWLWVCWWCLCCVGVGLCFFFFGSAIGVCGCGSSCDWWADGGVGVCGSIEVGFGSVSGSVGLLPGFFLVLTVYYGLLVVVVVVVVVVSGVCSVVVVIVVVE